jgi:hypothetical protein
MAALQPESWLRALITTTTTTNNNNNNIARLAAFLVRLG